MHERTPCIAANTVAGLIGTLLMVHAALLGAAQPDRPYREGHWIVELDAPPSLEFRGGEVALASAQGRGQVVRLAPTAPSVTGQSRFDAGSPAVVEYVAALDLERAVVLDRAAVELGRALHPTQVYRHLFNGFAVSMSEAEAARLARLPGVRSVSRDWLEFLHTDAGPQWIGADLVWSGAGNLPGGANRGAGMVIGVIDTGINWDSPFFSGFGLTNPRPGFLGLCNPPNIPCNAKLIGVYDFTTEGTQGFDPDNHGSHVASTAAGAPLQFSLDFGTGQALAFSTSGVAPQASLISYKACENGDPDDPDAGEYRRVRCAVR